MPHTKGRPDYPTEAARRARFHAQQALTKARSYLAEPKQPYQGRTFEDLATKIGESLDALDAVADQMGGAWNEVVPPEVIEALEKADDVITSVMIMTNINESVAGLVSHQNDLRHLISQAKKPPTA